MRRINARLGKIEKVVMPAGTKCYQRIIAGLKLTPGIGKNVERVFDTVQSITTNGEKATISTIRRAMDNEWSDSRFYDYLRVLQTQNRIRKLPKHEGLTVYIAIEPEPEPIPIAPIPVATTPAPVIGDDQVKRILQEMLSVQEESLRVLNQILIQLKPAKEVESLDLLVDDTSKRPVGGLRNWFNK